jgi:hypothetical protein
MPVGEGIICELIGIGITQHRPLVVIKKPAILQVIPVR